MKMIRYMLLILEKKHQKLSEKQKIGIKSVKMCADISHAPFISDKTYDIICIILFSHFLNSLILQRVSILMDFLTMLWFTDYF